MGSMVLVTGVPSNTDREELLTHFRKYGEVADTADQDDSSIIIKYKQRRSAEAAIAAGKIFGDTTLGLSWHNTFAKSQIGAAAAEEENGEESTPYQEDYLPPGLEEIEGGGEEEEINENLLEPRRQVVILLREPMYSCVDTTA